MRIPLLNTILIILISILGACQVDEQKKVESIEGPSASELIRNPMTLSGDSDTTNIPIITFDREVIFFDTIAEGEIVVENFKFTNTGKTPLWITDARSTCGCTVPDYPKEPIPPGEGGEIIVRFNTADKYYLQDRPISIFANTIPGRSEVRLRGYVQPVNESEN